ncbi:MAG: efflux RND transporter periplasmic adaptor subunit [Candidatus Hydrogenedentes bacterium]|nr:efflux RND transporter periplasmic adaptor subunit [Candidatus Hydrogenedentota bacterium]
MRRYALGAVLALLISGALWLALRKPPLAVEAGSVVRREVREVILEDAETRLPRTFTVDMPLTGTVSVISLNPGDNVEQGQVVATIEGFDIEQEIRGLEARIEQAKAQIQGVETMRPKPEEIQAAHVKAAEAADSVTIARKNLETARNNLADAQRELDRQQKLFAQNIVSKKGLEDAQLRMENLTQEIERLETAVGAAQKDQRASELQAASLEASVNDKDYLRDVYNGEIENLQSSLASFRNNLHKAEIRAPLTGTVLERKTDGGVFLAAGTPLLVLGNLKDVELQIDVLSEEVPRVAVGDPVEMTGRALGGQTVTGQVSQIYPSGFSKISALGIEQQRVRVIAQFDNSTLQLRPGTRLDARIITAVSPNTLAAPERAVFRRDDRDYVFAIKGGRAVLSPVTVGLRNDDWAEILDGLNEGDTVITEHRTDLEPGARARPINP